MRRRKFLKTSVGLGAWAGKGIPGVRLGGSGRNAATGAALLRSDEPAGKIGRPVRVVSLAYKGHERPIENIVQLVDSEGYRGADIVALAETYRGITEQSQEPLDGPAVTAMAALAKKHRTYIVCPIDRRDGTHRLNSCVLIDREGRVAAVYNKVFPWLPEFKRVPPIEPGQETVVHQADFGRVGFAICFDSFFNEVWQRLSTQGAELVIYPSDAPGGILLVAQAVNYHYYIVSATHTPDCQVVDIAGEELVYKKGDDLLITRVTLDLDRGIYCTDSVDANSGGSVIRDKLLKEHGDDVMQDKYIERDGWFVLKAKRPGVSARELARSYGLEELRDFIQHCREICDRRRGWEFSERLCAEKPKPT
ncbi:MAG: carbon-nitrogen hydrolase family protein [Terriglobia bacterium]